MNKSFDSPQKGHFGVPLLCANVFAYASFIYIAAFWLAMPLSLVVPRIAMISGPQALQAMVVPVVLAGVSALLGSRLWKIALPLALLMFFFVMYANGV